MNKINFIYLIGFINFILLSGCNVFNSDSCSYTTCPEHSFCTSFRDTTTCECYQGYVLRNNECIKPCEGITCSNHGTCNFNNSYYKAVCDCDDGFVVRNNTECVSPCEGVTCSNHGTCFVENNVAICDCEEGFQVENNINCVDKCDYVSCGNGTCINESGNLSCDCIEGFEDLSLKCVQIACNNGYLNSNEICDTIWLNGKTCFDFSYKNGTLSCSVGCSFVLSSCRNSYVYGSTKDDLAYDLIVNQNNVFITGKTLGAIGENTDLVDYDIFVTKLNNSLIPLWTKQFGTDKYEEGLRIAADSQNNIYILGYGQGALNGETFKGEKDIILMKLNKEDGNKIWTRQIGTSKSEQGRAIYIDSNDNIYITGYTNGSLEGNITSGKYDIFVIKLDVEGNILFQKQLGTNNDDFSNGIYVDENNIYLTGQTTGAFENQTQSGSGDLFLLKLNLTDEIITTTQLGSTKEDYATFLDLDSNKNIFISAWSYGDISEFTNKGEKDIFVFKFDSDLKLKNTYNFGTTLIEENFYVKVFDNNVFITGQSNEDMFSIELNNDLIEIKKNVIALTDEIRGRAIYPTTENVFVTGWTKKGFDGNNSVGDIDIFITKFGKH